MILIVLPAANVVVNKPETVTVSVVPELAGDTLGLQVAVPLKSPLSAQLEVMLSIIDPGVDIPNDLYSHFGKVITTLLVAVTAVPIVT